MSFLSFCPFVLLENWKNIGRFEKNISIIEIKHWDISIQISQCFFFIFVYLNTSLYVKSGNINDLHRQLIQWEIHIGFNLRCQGVDQKCAVALFLIHNVGASCCKQHEARDLHFSSSHIRNTHVFITSQHFQHLLYIPKLFKKNHLKH